DWIRLHYTYPTGFPLDLLEVIANNEKVCNYIDIPVQHISNSILASMKRNITSTQTYNLLDKIRDKLPDAAIRTTLIAGYPGESEKNFRELKDFIRTFRFDRLGIFTYSHEEDTPAFNLKNNIPEEVKQQRAAEIMEIQEKISLEKNRDKIGKIYKVIIDRNEGDYYVGRTQYDSPEVDNEVLIPTSADKTVKVGKFYQVHITDAESFDLFGIVKDL
ncbi:MAG: radical SAM protein, partial [Bacteroidales bacterium]|nr:radical SAM protein [Bacteroidales bacterium]